MWTGFLIKKYLLTLLTVFLCMTIGLGPLYAQLDQRRGFDRPMQDGREESFRQRDLSEQLVGGAAQQDSGFLERGTMMTQSTTSGLVYQVHVLGEVKNPGTYRVMASERVGEVLQRAGGVADQGSERRIEIRRDGKTTRTVDLLKFQLYGKLDHNPYLLDNDVIFVPLKKSSIQIVGAVKRPKTYELVGEKTAWDAIQLAGGFSTGVAKNEPVRIIRFVDGEKELEEVVSTKAELSRFPIRNGDVVYASNVITAGHNFDYDIAKLPGDNVFYPSYEDRVFVLGGVMAPGAYSFNPYYNVHQYISLAGGFTKLSTKKMRLLTPDGKSGKINTKKPAQINPGDTILIGEKRIPPEGWVSLFMSLGSFGLSTTATVLTLTK